MNTGGDAASYTNGFPSRLVYGVSFRAGPSTRLIPEMNFTCHGIITSYTAALMDQRGEKDPKIQVWRGNASQPGSYYKMSVDIAISENLCVGGLTNVSREVFHCSLNMNTTRVSVQPGDILGLELPKWNDDDIRLAFARVSSGPTNYVFNTRESQLSIINSSALLRPNWVAWELPQIMLETGSGKYRLYIYNAAFNINFVDIATQN